jgi:DNA-binding IclR family transcriptional regulator
MFGGKPTDLIQSVSRALRILEVVGDDPAGLNAKQIAQQCGLALPTA